MAVTALPFLLLALTFTSHGAAIVPASLENEAIRPYNDYKCVGGAVQKPNAVIDCLPTLAEMRGESAQPHDYYYQIWRDSPHGCSVTATRLGLQPTVLVVPEVPAELIFLLFRCFLSDRAVWSSSASIMSGYRQGYAIQLIPPAPSAEGQSANTTFGLSSNAAEGAETSKIALQIRAPVRCATKSSRRAGAFSDCLGTMLKILNEPGSGIPMSWDTPSDTREWRTDNCIIVVSPNTNQRSVSLRDVFTERSLIPDIFWIMGKCFAGLEEGKGFDWGEMSVGGLRKWKVTVIWGTPSARLWVAPVENSTVARANNTSPLLSVTVNGSVNLDTTS